MAKTKVTLEQNRQIINNLSVKAYNYKLANRIALAERRYGIGCLDPKTCPECGKTIEFDLADTSYKFVNRIVCSRTCSGARKTSRAHAAHVQIKTLKYPLKDYWAKWNGTAKLQHLALTKPLIKETP